MQAAGGVTVAPLPVASRGDARGFGAIDVAG